jgi:hypothetical protein
MLPSTKDVRRPMKYIPYIENKGRKIFTLTKTLSFNNGEYKNLLAVLKGNFESNKLMYKKYKLSHLIFVYDFNDNIQGMKLFSIVNYKLHFAIFLLTVVFTFILTLFFLFSLDLLLNNISLEVLSG